MGTFFFLTTGPFNENITAGGCTLAVSVNLYKIHTFYRLLYILKSKYKYKIGLLLFIIIASLVST